ncbi:MAG: hypothetical protein IPJ71_19785 [Bdellovibrionales bacterium]|nr:hypothetical protein [Bdellovibrionales bacterium]
MEFHSFHLWKNSKGDKRLIQTKFKCPSLIEGSARQMLKGRWPAACSRCKTVESAAERSGRQIENWRFADRIAEIIKVLNNVDEQQSFPLIWTSDLETSAILFVACQSESKQKWSLEWNRVQIDLGKNSFLLDGAINMTGIGEKSSNPFKAILPHIRNFHVAGGEPLIIPETLNS